MGDESGSSTPLNTPEDANLFQIGSAEQRIESLIHSILLVLVAFFTASVLIGVGNGLLAGAGLGSESAPVAAELTTTALNFVGLFVVTGLYLSWRNDWSMIGLRAPTKRDVGAIVAGAIGLVVFMYVADIAFSYFGLEPDENVAVETGREHPELFLYYIPIVLLLNAPAEEFLFRGVVQGLFRRAYGVVPGIIAASALFGLVHYVALAGEGSAIAYVVIAFASGIILGALYEYTGNLVVPTIVHAIWNILVYLSLYVETTGVL